MNGQGEDQGEQAPGVRGADVQAGPAAPAPPVVRRGLLRGGGEGRQDQRPHRLALHRLNHCLFLFTNHVGQMPAQKKPML